MADVGSRGGNYYFGDQAPLQSGVKIVRRWEVGGRRLADKRVIGGAGLHCQHPQSHSGQRRRGASWWLTSKIQAKMGLRNSSPYCAFHNMTIKCDGLWNTGSK